MYDVNDYGRMMADPIRMNAYTEALRRTVKPGNVVVDVGTGTGIFAMLAARFGARKVYAIDTNPCIHLAREVARRNGFGDTIEFIHKSVFDVELPEKADVLVSDCRGAFTLHRRHPEMVFVSRERLLKPGGAILPLRDDLLVGAIQSEAAYTSLCTPWHAASLDWAPFQQMALGSCIDGRDLDISDARTIVAPTPWTTIDYRSSTETRIHGEATAIASAGTLHFLTLLFRAHVTEDLGYSAEAIQRVYAPLLLPLHIPLQLEPNEPVTITIDAFPTADDYVFAWRLRTQREERRQATDGNPKRSLPLEFAGGTGQPTFPRVP